MSVARWWVIVTPGWWTRAGGGSTVSVMRLSRYIAPAVLAGLLLILVAGVSRARTRAPVPHPAPHPATHPAPFALEAFAATSDRSWWVLGTSVCPRPWCLSIRHTSDA